MKITGPIFIIFWDHVSPRFKNQGETWLLPTAPGIRTVHLCFPLKYILPRSNIIKYTCENRQYNCCTYWSPDNPWSSTIENTFFKGSVIFLYNLYFIFRCRYWINLKTFFSKCILWNGQGERISKIEFPLLFSNYTL